MTATIITDPRHPARALARAVAALSGLTLVCKAPGFVPRPLPPSDFMSALECLHPTEWIGLSEHLAYDLARGAVVTFPNGETVRATQSSFNPQ